MSALMMKSKRVPKEQIGFFTIAKDVSEAGKVDKLNEILYTLNIEVENIIEKIDMEYCTGYTYKIK